MVDQERTTAAAVTGVEAQASLDADRHLEQLLPKQSDRIWIFTIVQDLKEFFTAPKVAPGEWSSKPLERQEDAGRDVIGGTVEDADQHLHRLLAKQSDRPLATRIFQDLKEYFFPPKLPPLQLTSKPVAVKSIWGFSGGHGSKAGMSSTLIHVSVVALLFLVGTNKHVQEAVKNQMDVIDLAPYIPTKPAQQQMGGGGGGGDRSPLPASKGKLPKIAPRQFTPPAVVIHNEQPKLIMEPTIIAQADAPLPNVNMAVFGDPLSKIGPPSNGTGSGAGIGSGRGGGVGSGDGAGVGPGKGGGFGGGVYRIGGGVSAPVLLHKVEPEYSEEARKAKFQGTVVLYVVVDDKGTPQQLKVVRPLGLGLDEKAIEAVQKWKFRPGYLNGKAVSVAATIEVNFRLL
jgi:TonB family protein